MAAAARWNGPEAALKEIKNKLAALQAEIRSPSNLEKKIEHVRQTLMQALEAALAEYEATTARPVGRAARLKLQDLEFAVDAFYDFVVERESHTSDEHAIGRARVAKYLRDTLEETIDHFGTP